MYCIDTLINGSLKSLTVKQKREVIELVKFQTNWCCQIAASYIRYQGNNGVQLMRKDVLESIKNINIVFEKELIKKQRSDQKAEHGALEK